MRPRTAVRRARRAGFRSPRGRPALARRTPSSARAGAARRSPRAPWRASAHSLWGELGPSCGLARASPPRRSRRSRAAASWRPPRARAARAAPVRLRVAPRQQALGPRGGATARACSARGERRARARRRRRRRPRSAAPGDQATSFTRTPGGAPAAGSATPTPPSTSEEPRRAVSATPATIQRLRGPSATAAAMASADAAPLAAEPANAPSALLSAPPPPTPAPRMARMVPRAPPSQSKVCVAAKKLTSTAAARSAVEAREPPVGGRDA